MASSCNDRVFGPISNCRPVDFTLSSEAIALSILPDALFAVFAFSRLEPLRRQPSIVIRHSWLAYLKVCTALLVIASNGATLATYVLNSGLRASIPAIVLAACALSLATSFILAGVVALEHLRSPAPSTLIIFYAFLKAIFEAITLRSYHKLGLNDTHPSIFVTLAVSVISYFLTLFVELVEKKSIIKPELRDQYIGETTSSVISRGLFLWLLPTMHRGRYTKLKMEDIASIPADYQAAPTREPLLTALHAQSQDAKPNISLVRATMSAFGAEFFLPVIPRLVLLAATYTQPFLVQTLISFVQDQNSSTSTSDTGRSLLVQTPMRFFELSMIGINDDAEKGWVLVLGFVSVYALMTGATAVYWEKVYSVTVKYRAALVGAIYGKTLRLAAYEGRDVSSGGATTLMSVDVERITEGIERANEFCASLFAVPIGLAILWSQVSWAAMAPLIVILFVFAITSTLGKPVSRHQAQWLAATDNRVKLISSILGHFLPIKMSGYEDLLAKKVEGLRGIEVGKARAFYNLLVITILVSNVAETLCGLATLGTYAFISLHKTGEYNLDVAKIFSILTTINLLNMPINQIGQGLPSILAAYASLHRIQAYLGREEKSLLLAAPENDTLKIKNGSFSWSKKADAHDDELSNEPILREVNLELQNRKLHMLVGPVASGKTALLMTMLGETVLVEGAIWASPGVVAYASQDAFIGTGTCRENIVFGLPFNQAWYDKVVDACALRKDFDGMPTGDQTKLGDKGTGLSGGQRQRLALARAIYADAPTLLLDDVLSALDGETERHVFDALFGPMGLLKNKTVVLATHNTRHLSSADWIIVLEMGRITHQGTLKDIQSSNYNLLERRDLSQPGTEQVHNQPVEEKTAAGEKESLSNALSESDTEEAKSYDQNDWVPYKFYAFHAGYSAVIRSTCLLLLWVATGLGIQVYLKAWSSSDGYPLSKWLGGYAGFTVASILTAGLALVQHGIFIMRGSSNVHHAELNAVFNAPPAFFHSTSVGQILNRFSSDIFAIDFQFPIALLNVISGGGMIIGTFMLIYIATPWLTFSAPPLAIGYYLLIKFYLGTSKQFQQLEAASKSPLYTSLTNVLNGLETVRAFHAQNYFESQNDVFLNHSQGPYYHRFAGLRFLRTVLMAVTFLLAFGVSSLAIGLRHTTSAGFLGIALSSLTKLAGALSHFVMAYSSLENSAVSIRRVHEIVNIVPERDEGIVESATALSGSHWSASGSIAFDNFTMKYRDDLPPALKGISFTIKGGQKVGICGRTGSGKSSTVMALFRNVDQSLLEGKILVDGVDISTLPLSLLRSSMSLVSQEPFLWLDTIRNLIDPEDLYTDESIWSALDRVGLKEAILTLSEKLDTVINDSLSRGQKQLLCLARALLRETKTVVLDEATSSMDIHTDEKIRQVVRHDMQAQTVIAVAHRIATIINFDMILVLDDGRVAEWGTPKDLLDNPDSRFHALAKTQGLDASHIAAL